MEKKDTMAAFPNGTWQTGMALRDYFACSVLNGFVSNQDWFATAVLESKDAKAGAAMLAEGAYMFADAMLAARQA